ncbi:Bud-site selection protein [Coprinopsis sp. MPI-PUGE-AT-0042]|nr:Bud-site selection protein [Coprinopsis sp. MPI-PUGE-AT-0042]
METTKKAGVKRKAREISKDDLATRVGGKLHHELQEAQQAAKKAKVFETQRLVKKLKGLRKNSGDSPEVKDNEAQLALLKEIDARSIANTAYKTKLLKDKALRENELVQKALENEIQSNLLTLAAASTSLGKVQSRLLSSKLLASQITTSLDSLKGIIDPERASKQKKAKVASKPSIPERKAAKALVSRGSESSDGEEEVEEGEGDGGWESGSVDSGFAGRPRPADSDGSEASDMEGGAELDEGDSTSLEVESDDDVRQSSVKSPSSKSAKPARAEVSQPSQSTFLPSLQTAYISGSDDDSDIEDEAQIAEPRKNRRGQRARRAIWEKKFGRNANHKKAEAKATAETQAKRPQGKSFGSTRAGDRKKQGVRGPLLSGSNLEISEGARRTFGQPAAPSARPPAPQPAKPAAQGLHPSWEARKRLKEKESISIVPSQGKKIKF